MSDYPGGTMPGGTALPSVSPDALTKVARQGSGSLPADTPFAQMVLARVGAASPPKPGAGPRGFVTGGRTTPASGLPGGGPPLSGLPTRPTGTFFPGSGVYEPPGYPPGGGTLPGVPAGAAPSDGPYVVTQADSRLPNASVQRTIVSSATAPTNILVLWRDTSQTPPVLNFYDGTAWTSLQGGAGAEGPPGPTGATGPAAQPFTFNQGTPASTWVIVHNLGKIVPAIAVYDSAGSLWEPGTVSYDSSNQCTLTFSAAFSGTAYVE